DLGVAFIFFLANRDHRFEFLHGESPFESSGNFIEMKIEDIFGRFDDGARNKVFSDSMKHRTCDAVNSSPAEAGVFSVFYRLSRMLQRPEINAEFNPT